MTQSTDDPAGHPPGYGMHPGYGPPMGQVAGTVVVTAEHPGIAGVRA